MERILFIDKQTDYVISDKKVVVRDNQRVVTSFIGKSPIELTVEGKDAKVWEIIRCGARYHHDGICDIITTENSARFYCDFYNLEVRNNKFVKLYKRVKDDFTDYFSGKYIYLPGTTVIAKDWLMNERIVCRNALHLCATKEQSNQWNEGGKLLKCEVELKDMCIFPYNISQVRCKKVDVLHSKYCHYACFCDQPCNCDGDNT